MSLARSLMDAYDFGRKIGDDVRSVRETGKNVAQIERESKQDMRNLQRDQFNYRKKNDERQRKVNQAKNVFEYQIASVVESMQKNNATPEQYAVFNDKVKSEYGEILSYLFGKKSNGEVNFDIGYSTIKKEPTGSSMMMITAENVEKIYPDDSVFKTDMLKQIEENGGSMLAKIDYTEDGRQDISSIPVNYYLDAFKKMGLTVTDEEDFNKYKEMIDAIYGAKKRVDQNKGDGNDKKGGKNIVENVLRELEGSNYKLKSANNPPVSNETKVTTKKDKEIVKPVDNETIVDNTKYNSQKEAEAQAKKTGVYGVYLYKNPEGRIVKGLIRNKTQ